VVVKNTEIVNDAVEPDDTQDVHTLLPMILSNESMLVPAVEDIIGPSSTDGIHSAFAYPAVEETSRSIVAVSDCTRELNLHSYASSSDDLQLISSSGN
jgi:hypothetical protein